VIRDATVAEPAPAREHDAGGSNHDARCGPQPPATSCSTTTWPSRHRAGPRPPPRAGRPFAELTQREYDILDLIAQGLDNQTIARRLVLSPKTVRNHVSNVFTKLNVADRSHAIVLGRERGLGQGPD
jgi:DNA-binding NarL/FixJ family response regulator